MKKQRNDCEEQKQMNQSCTYMENQETACPQKQQNKKQCYKHDAFLRGRNAATYPAPSITIRLPHQTGACKFASTVAGGFRHSAKPLAKIIAP